jgi:hypothetical protein
MAVAPSARTRVRRVPARGAYDRDTIDSILDETLISHVGLVQDGEPVVIPTLHARLGDRLYLHGSAASRLLRTLAGGAPVCATATLIDGVVLARSAFHHSVNYRSVVVFGQARKIEDLAEHRAALDVIVEALVPGRSADVRPPSDKETKATIVLELPLDEFSVKQRTGEALDEPEDMDLPVWAGVLPLALRPGAPIPNPDLGSDAPPPPTYVSGYRRRGW